MEDSSERKMGCSLITKEEIEKRDKILDEILSRVNTDERWNGPPRPWHGLTPLDLRLFFPSTPPREAEWKKNNLDFIEEVLKGV
jgi:hypothetical protein